MYLVCRLLLCSPSRYPLFPYTTLFRSCANRDPVPLAGSCGMAVTLPVFGRATPPRRRPSTDTGDQTRAHWTPAPVRPSALPRRLRGIGLDRKSTRLNSSHRCISYAVFCSARRRDIHSFPTRRSSDLAQTEILSRLPAVVEWL